MKARKNNLMILGGYGAADRAIAKEVLKHTSSNLTIAGRDLKKSEAFVTALQEHYPKRLIKACFADAGDKGVLKSILKDIDLLIVTTTTPDSIAVIAEAALETETDLLDIFVRGDVVDQLSAYREQIIRNERRFITQGGFHPGLIAPIIRYVNKEFDSFLEVNVYMAMALIVETPESVQEIIYETIEGGAETLKDGKWVKASFRDVVTTEFSDHFGTKECYPFGMKEIQVLENELGLKTIGVYAAGFKPFIDYFVFSLAILIGFFSKRLSQKICGKLMFWSIRNDLHKLPKVELKLEAKGVKDNQEVQHEFSLFAEDGYELTALAVVGCVNQYLDNTISQPGLYLMGNVVDHNRIINDLIGMGVQMKEAGRPMEVNHT